MGSVSCDVCLSLGLPAVRQRQATSAVLAEIYLGPGEGILSCLPHMLSHFLSDDPDAGQSWQENPPLELELGSFCIFFLTHD